MKRPTICTECTQCTQSTIIFLAAINCTDQKYFIGRQCIFLLPYDVRVYMYCIGLCSQYDANNNNINDIGYDSNNSDIAGVRASAKCKIKHQFNTRRIDIDCTRINKTTKKVKK